MEKTKLRLPRSKGGEQTNWETESDMHTVLYI